MITRRRAFLGIMSIATLSCAGLASTPAMAADDRLLADILAGITDAVARLATGADAATVLADLDAEVRELYGQ